MVWTGWFCPEHEINKIILDCASKNFNLFDEIIRLIKILFILTIERICNYNNDMYKEAIIPYINPKCNIKKSKLENALARDKLNGKIIKSKVISKYFD